MIEILSAGLLTTVQDLGRQGLRHLGVVRSGAADGAAHALAQALVGNPPGAAGFEFTLRGPRLRFTTPTVVALVGEVEAHVAGMPVPRWRPLSLAAGVVLELGQVVRGARAYCAVAGGLDVPLVLGSRSTDRRSGFGGHHGRALRAGDVLAVLPGATARGEAGHNAGVSAASWSVRPLDSPDERAALRVLAGAELELLTPPSRQALFATAWSVGADSDRMGLALDGATLGSEGAAARVSAPVLPGCVQVPASGRPVLLGVDAQTVGGYPIVAHVIRADLDRAMQLRPGDPVRLSAVTAEVAAAAWATRRAELAQRSSAIAARLADEA